MFVPWLKCLKLFLRLAANTAGICSLFCITLFVFVSCAPESRKRSATVKVGGAFNLLTLDPLSVNALGDSRVFSLIYDRVFRISSQKVESIILEDVEIKNKSLKFKSVSQSLYEDLKNAYQKGLESTLWSKHFEKFEFTPSVLINKGEGSFEDLKIISSYWMLQGDKHGAFEVSDFKKNQKIILKSRTKNQKVIFYRMKSLSQGLSALTGKKIDLYFNEEVITNEIISKEFLNLKFIKKPDSDIFIRLYKKNNSPHYLSKLILKERKTIEKILGKDWKPSRSIDEEDTKAPKNLKLLFNHPDLQKVVDFLSPLYREKYGVSLNYEQPRGYKLAEAISKGDFDYYFSLVAEKKTGEVYYNAFHSKGLYNSYEVRSTKLDSLLEEKKQRWQPQERREIDQKIKLLLKQESFVSLEYRTSLYSPIIRKKDRMKRFEFLLKKDL